MEENNIQIYQIADGQIQVQLQDNSVWLRQEPMAKLFGRGRTVITRHINNVFEEGVLIEKSNVQNMHIRKKPGFRSISP
jgi:hypothetical protein